MNQYMIGYVDTLEKLNEAKIERIAELERENVALRELVKELERKLAAEAEYAAETHARHQGLVEQVEHLIGIIQQLESDLARFGTIEAFEQKKEARP